MDLQLTPYVSAGQFKIGALKKNINEVLGSDFEFYSYSYSSDVTDHYKKHGLQFDYDNGNICISIQIEKPSFAFYRNKNLHEQTFLELKYSFKSIEKNAYADDNNLLLLDIGIGLSFKNHELEGTPEVVTIFKKNLFDNYLYQYEKIW